MDIRAIIIIFLVKIGNPSTLRPSSTLKLLVWDCFMDLITSLWVDLSIDTNKPLPPNLYCPPADGLLHAYVIPCMTCYIGCVWHTCCK